MKIKNGWRWSSVVTVGKKKVTVTIGDEMYSKLEKIAISMGTSIPTLIVMYASEYVYQKEMMNKVPELMNQIEKLSRLETEKQ